MPIPMVKNIYTSKVFVNEEMRRAVNEVFDSGMFVMGKKKEEFEKKFAEFIGSKYAIAISNGTTALEVTLQSLGIGKGDEVIVPSHTAFPTIEPILQLSATPVFVDIDPKIYTIDPKAVERAVTKKTKVIMPVHLYGHPADLDPIIEICKEKNIFLVEDACQAHNAKYKGKIVGSFGIAGCFSFYPSKNVTVCGDGGMIVTNDEEINKKARMLLNHGQDGNYNHVILGHNYRLSEIQCAIGIKQLEMIEHFTKRRREIAELYQENLKDTKLILPFEAEYARHVYHLYVIRTEADKRDKIIEGLKKEGIHCGIHYPIPCHQQEAVKHKEIKVPFLPITEKIVKEIITLPIYPLLKDEEVKMISEKIKKLI